MEATAGLEYEPAVAKVNYTENAERFYIYYLVGYYFYLLGGLAMTKQEVNYNIKYNENLVRQYTNEISSLNSKINNCNSQISNYRNQFSQLQKKLNEALKEAQELEQLLKKYKNLLDNFIKKQTARKNALLKNSAIKPSVKFISSYFKGMNDLLLGSEYKKVYNGLNDAISKINSKLKSVRNTIDSLNQELRNTNNRIDSLNNSVSSYRSQINSTNTQLTYRRQRITYWKNQLKYAT